MERRPCSGDRSAWRLSGHSAWNDRQWYIAGHGKRKQSLCHRLAGNCSGVFFAFCLKFYLEHQSSCKRLACERLKLAENINRWPALLQQMASKRVHDNFITQQQIIVYPKFKIFGKAAMQSHLNGFKKLNKAVMVLSLHEWLKSEWVINVVKNNHHDFKSAWRPELI